MGLFAFSEIPSWTFLAKLTLRHLAAKMPDFRAVVVVPLAGEASLHVYLHAPVRLYVQPVGFTLRPLLEVIQGPVNPLPRRAACKGKTKDGILEKKLLTCFIKWPQEHAETFLSSFFISARRTVQPPVSSSLSTTHPSMTL